jgi:hypothetical protein
MKNPKWFLLLLLAGAAICSCRKSDDNPANSGNPEVRSFTGKVQKGPFIRGTTITLQELNDDLGQTGK